MAYTKSTTRFVRPIYSTSFSVFANNDAWAKISPEDQAAIMSVSGAALGAAFGAEWDKQVKAAEAGYAAAGMTVVEADPAFEQALIEASAFVTEGWLAKASAKGIDAQGALDFYKAKIVELSN
jgi:TRAP-type C4-dicarboxylate transport system substrate-binding protein